MNKNKIIIIVVASVLAAAIVVAGIIFGLTKAFSFVGDKTESDIAQSSQLVDSTENNTSGQADTTSSENDKGSSTQASASSSDKNTPSSNSSIASSATNSVLPSDCTITAGNASGKKGKIVKVPVSIAANPGIMAMIFDIEYDSSLIKYTGYSEGNVLSDYEFSENKGKLTFLNVEQNNVAKNGNLFFLEFEIISNKAQDCKIEIKIRDDGFCNFDEQLIGVKSKSGKITIK